MVTFEGKYLNVENFCICENEGLLAEGTMLLACLDVDIVSLTVNLLESKIDLLEALRILVGGSGCCACYTSYENGK